MLALGRGAWGLLEDLTAVKLFRQAVERETATAVLGRRLFRFLERARHDPALRFEP